MGLPLGQWLSARRGGSSGTIRRTAGPPPQPAFSAQCGFCHGRDAMGGESGPDLTRAAIVAADVRGDKIVSAHIYRSWEDAKSAAGVPDRGEAPLERKLSRSAWRFMQRVQDRLGGGPGGFGDPGFAGP